MLNVNVCPRPPSKVVVPRPGNVLHNSSPNIVVSVPTTIIVPRPPYSTVKVREVWASNLVEEFNIIGGLIDHYNHVAIDTEFPGIIYKTPAPTYLLSSQSKYESLKANADHLKLIQLGFTLSDAVGNLPCDANGTRFVWEFNFADFNPATDRHAPESVELLRNSGIDLERNLFYGVDVRHFAWMMIAKKMVLNPKITWITFQGSYDFALAVRALTSYQLPATVEEFMWLVWAYFGKNIYDVKYMMRHCGCYSGGLDKVANMLHVERVTGRRHQAGSDSLLTVQSYMKMKTTYFREDGGRPHAGVIFGLELNDYSRS